MTEKLFGTFSGDIVEMFKEHPELHDKIVRYWLLENENDKAPDYSCEYAYIRKVIWVGDKIYLGLQPYNYDSMYFYPPEKLIIEYYEYDQEK